MWKKLRIGILLFILFLVAADTYLTKFRSVSWDDTLWVGVYPINPDANPKTARYIENLQDRKEILLVERNNPQALADTICELKANPTLREQLGQAGHARFLSGNSMTALGATMVNALKTIL